MSKSAKKRFASVWDAIEDTTGEAAHNESAFLAHVGNHQPY